MTQPWHPITNTIDLKTLGKLLEETNELGSAAARCLIQGLDGTEPTTGKENVQWLVEEIADVLANIDLVKERFDLSEYNEEIQKRIDRKKAQLREWHRMA